MSALFSLFASVLMCALSHFEHTRSVRPSSLLCIYLVLSCAFDAIEARTLWLRDNFQVVAPVFTAAVIVKCAVLILEAQQKRRLVISSRRWLSPAAISGIFSRCLLFWLRELFGQGFRRILTSDDLFTTDEALSSAHLQSLVCRLWSKLIFGPYHRILAKVDSHR